MKKKKGSGLKTAMEIGAGAALTAAAGVGTYLLAGPHGKANRKKLETFGAKVRREAVAEFKKMKSMDEAAYKKAVQIAAARFYEEFREVGKPEIERLISELHGQWRSVRRQLKGALAKKEKIAKPKAKNRSAGKKRA